uniref:transmembrane protease serine 2-like n=1 Tax=Centroberyx gerrardi TaxID=166262 RepID=UPI003AAFECBE
MTTNPYLDSGPHFIHGGSQDGEKPPPFSPAELQPQYVHQLTPNPDPLPPPELTHPIPHRKGVKQRCIKFTVAAVISLLLLLLVAGVLLGYYLSSTCVHGVACGDGSCVWESQWCDGVRDCPRGQDEAACLRLYGSSFLLQIYSSQSKSWRTVCSHGWTDQQGKASCQHIGYSKSTYFKSGQQKTDSGNGFLIVKPESRPETPILQQLVHSNACPNNSVVTLRCIDCGSGVNSSRALGGQPATLGSWPWQVSLQVEGSHRCGGAIITPYWILTAAHCVAGNSNPADWTVYAGVVDSLGALFNPAHSVSRIVAHEDYSSLTLRNDIALMKLSNPFHVTASRNIGPVCLPTVGLNITAPQSCWISGFGGTENGVSPYLMEAEVSLVDSADCNSSIAYNGRITQDMLCAGATEAGAHACHGDGGGPLVAQRDGVWWLLGDSSWGDQCTVQNTPGVYGNVTYFLGWIYHQLGT